jgi:OHCU decarboxylase
LPEDQAEQELLQCCGSRRWAREVADGRTYPQIEALLAESSEVWRTLPADEWLEAFRSHPKIGEQKAADTVSARSQAWSGQEQAGVSNSSAATVNSLAALNRAYELKFGFIFIICATGKSSAEMLSALRERLENDADTELRIAAEEQRKIMELRLRKLVG